jgi:hypothetical protein
MTAEDDEQARRERAETLRMRIEELRSKDAPHRPPRSPREFVEERAREEARHEHDIVDDAESDRDDAG